MGQWGGVCKRGKKSCHVIARAIFVHIALKKEQVYFDIVIGGEPAGRIVFGLYGRQLRVAGFAIL